MSNQMQLLTWADLVGRPKAADRSRQKVQQLLSIVLEYVLAWVCHASKVITWQTGLLSNIYILSDIFLIFYISWLCWDVMSAHIFCNYLSDGGAPWSSLSLGPSQTRPLMGVLSRANSVLLAPPSTAPTHVFHILLMHKNREIVVVYFVICLKLLFKPSCNLWVLVAFIYTDCSRIWCNRHE